MLLFQHIIDLSMYLDLSNQSTVKNDVEDYYCWLRAVEHTDCIYYDLGTVMVPITNIEL